MKKLLITLLKIGISAAIIGYLVWGATGTKNEAGENVFQQLLDRPKQWKLLAAAWLFCASAVMLTLVRWWYLVRALELPLRLTQGLRIGLFAYLVNFFPMGIAGGDLLKAVMLARRQRGHGVQAVASVVIDRLIGLYLLFVVASVAILLTGFWKFEDEEGYIPDICAATFALTAVGAVAITVLLIPGVTEGKGAKALARLPRIGPAIESLIESVRMYRRKLHVLGVAAVMSVGVHSLFATGVYLIACGLYEDVPPLHTHFVVTPLSAATGVLPIPVGPFEAVLELLYRPVGMPEYRGFIVALGYRLACILIAGVGICYYLASREETAPLIREGGQEQQASRQSQNATA